jgi:mRNA interferase RelE/StbE
VTGYNIVILRRAQRELVQLPSDSYARVRDAVRALSTTPRPVGSRKLTGREGWRLRVGDYRIVYEIDDDTRMVRVIHIGHRRDVYR